MNKEITDQEIVGIFKKDPEKAIELLFPRFFPYLCTVIYQFIPDAQVAEDLAQDLFYDLWRKRQKINFTGSIKAYLRRAAINKSMNYIRDKKPGIFEEITDQDISSDLNSSNDTELSELQDKVDFAINQLPERCRIIFILSRFDDMSYKEIAEMLDIKEKTVENQIGKALRILRKALGPLLSFLLPILINYF